MRIKIQAFIQLSLLIFCFSAFAEEWHEAYDSAIKEIERQNWAAAESKLLSAKAQQPKQGRVKAYGTRYIQFIPDYYLGLVYFNQKRYQQAITQFERAKGFLGPKDPEFTKMATMLQTARDSLTPPGPTPQEQNQKLIEALLAQAEKAIAAKNYAQAREQLKKAESLGEVKRVSELRESIERVEREETEATTKQQLYAGLITDANQMLAAKNFVKARELTKKAAELRIDDAKTADLLKMIDQTEAEMKRNQDKQQQFASLMEQANQALAAKNYAQARDLTTKAAALGFDNAKTNDLQKRIDQAEASIKQAETAAKKEQDKQQEYASLLKQADQALAAKNYALARELAKKATATSFNNNGANDLLKRIDQAEKATKQEQEKQEQLAKLMEKKEQESKVNSASIDRLEQDGILAFYSGKYKESIDIMERVVARNKDQAIAYFYLACGHAAMALLSEKEEKENLLKKARTQFAEARKIDSQLQYDTTYISPRILQALQ